MGFIGSVVARTAFSFFLPFKFFSGPSKLEIFAVNLSVSLHKFRGLQWTIGDIFGFVTGDGILMKGIIEVVSWIGIEWVNVLHYLFSADIERDVDIDRLAIGILLDGRIVVHLVIT
jgi:hypothetical protein